MSYAASLQMGIYLDVNDAAHDELRNLIESNPQFTDQIANLVLKAIQLLHWDIKNWMVGQQIRAKCHSIIEYMKRTLSLPLWIQVMSDERIQITNTPTAFFHLVTKHILMIQNTI
jgi:hypothetical protein